MLHPSRTVLGKDVLLPGAAAASLALGGALTLAGVHTPAHAIWAAVTIALLVPLSVSVVRSLVHGDVGVDAIALLAMAGALALGEYLAGAVIALMLAGGNALERVAQGRARRELTLLVDRAPKAANRLTEDAVERIDVEQVRVGDRLLVRAGEVIPTDGVVRSSEAIVDESALTGEPLPSTLHAGGTARGGCTNAGEAFELEATTLASDSAYAALVRLVREAERSQAPFVRMADRYAIAFLPLTLIVAGAAWAASGDARRAVAVLVVATPCPLILAAPIAFVSGVSRAAREGVIAKGGAVIEALGRARTVLFDKTGTLTLGTAEVDRIVALDGLPPDEALRIAASLDQFSTHAMATALVRAAERRGLRLTMPTAVREDPGQGIAGDVDGHSVAVGSTAFVTAAGAAAAPGDGGVVPGEARVTVAADGRVVAVIVMADRLRDDVAGLVADLRRSGVRHVALATGDVETTAEEIGRAAGVDRIYARQSPADKLELVRALAGRKDLAPVVMVGDGINDAPALALADVGIALGAAGATVASEAADAVIAVDRVDRVARAIAIGRRSIRIARQSVIAGLGLSVVGMGLAAVGYLPPVMGALFQEVIDVAVILNALRALGEGGVTRRTAG
jgi:heavy metal translocating P-type ATPase